MARWLWIVFLVACEKRSASELPAQVAKIDGIVLAPTGLYVKAKKVETHDQLAPRRAREIVASAKGPNVIVVPDVPGDSLAMILQGASTLERKAMRVGVFENGQVREGCNVDFVPKKHSNDPDWVQLSIYVTAERTWLGVSRINEFQEVPMNEPADKLDRILGEHKRSVFFVERQDIELAFDPSLPLASHLRALWAVCRHFHEVAVVAPADLAARPTL